MSDEVFNLHLGEDTYKLNPLVVVLSAALDFVLAEDVKNGAKNLKPPRPSPLASALKEQLAMLQEMFSKHGVPEQAPADVQEPAET